METIEGMLSVRCTKSSDVSGCWGHLTSSLMTMEYVTWSASLLMVQMERVADQMIQRDPDRLEK